MQRAIPHHSFKIFSCHQPSQFHIFCWNLSFIAEKPVSLIYWDSWGTLFWHCRTSQYIGIIIVSVSGHFSVELNIIVIYHFGVWHFCVFRLPRSFHTSCPCRLIIQGLFWNPFVTHLCHTIFPFFFVNFACCVFRLIFNFCLLSHSLSNAAVHRSKKLYSRRLQSSVNSEYIYIHKIVFFWYSTLRTI